MKALPRAVENKPVLAFLIIAGACFAPAFNTTVAEWQDAVDASTGTAWQPEVVIEAWSDGIRTMALAIYAYLTRSGTAGKTDG